MIMLGLHLGAPLTMGILPGYAPWRTLLKLPAIYAANSLAGHRVVQIPIVIELQSGREVILKLLIERRRVVRSTWLSAPSAFKMLLG